MGRKEQGAVSNDEDTWKDRSCLLGLVSLPGHQHGQVTGACWAGGRSVTTRQDRPELAGAHSACLPCTRYLIPSTQYLYMLDLFPVLGFGVGLTF